MPVNYEYITEEEQFLEAIEEIEDYINDPNWKEEGIKPLLAVDVETFGERLPYKRVPMPICFKEGEPTGLLRTVQIGLNPIYDPKRPFTNKQYVFDCLFLGYDLVKEKLKSILETVNIIGHNLKYDWQFLFAVLGIRPKYIVDTMLISKVLLAGDPVNHGLDDSYGRFLDFSWFKQETKCDEYPNGMTIDQYIDYKKKHQTSDWSGDLTENQKKYAAEDVYFIFYMVQEQKEWINDYRRVYESESRPKEKNK
jgi:DNA polymerase I-like protein with 3'-5' exonuclease and polymerase domains